MILKFSFGLLETLMLTCKETTTLTTNRQNENCCVRTNRQNKAQKVPKIQYERCVCRGSDSQSWEHKDPQSDGSRERQQQRLSALSFFVDSGAHTGKTAGHDGGLGGPCCSCPPPRLVPLGLVLLLPSLDQLLARTAREATFCQGVCCPGSGDELPFTT